MQIKSLNAFLISILLCPFITLGQEEVKKEKAQFSIYGFGRANLVWDSQDLGGNEAYIPNKIQVYGPTNPNFFIGVRQTRVGIDIKQPFGEDLLEMKIEGDFKGSSDVTGSFHIRHAYAKYKFLTIGMTWSNFFDIDANPNTVDFEGPNSSTLSRSPQLRLATYKSKNELSISFENPVEKVNTRDSVEVLPIRMPDLIGAYRINGDFGFVKAAVLLRELRYESDKPRSLLGYGASIMGMLKVGEKDKFKFQGVMGTGIAKYVEGASGLNYDAIYNGTNELEELQTYGTYISYQHFWNDKMHSSITAGWFGVEENSNLGPTDYQAGYYGSINIFFEPVKNFLFGWEALAGERVNINDDTGSSVRLQMNATYKFNKQQ
jgi:hypothetical protein